MTGSDDNHQTADFRPDGIAQRAFLGPREDGYVRVIAAFALASLSHLWLADAAQPEWAVPNGVYLVGLCLLATTRSAAGWLACGLGLLLPLLFLRDQLTQSLLLGLVCVAGVWTTMRRTPDTAAFLRVCRWSLVATYGFAAFHKLNHDFFDPAVGCATYGLVELATYYRLDPGTFSVLKDAHAPLAIALEIAIPVAYLADRRHLARLLAVIFHISLTMTMAPAFAFVMAVGHAAFLTDGDVAELQEIWQRRGFALLCFAIVVTTASLVLHGELPEWTMIPRELLLWLALGWTALALIGGRAAPADWQTSTSTMPVVVVTVFCLNCLTPYLGLQFQHSAAMLSNLRIDRGCWNHLIVPESMRLTEDYVRVDEVVFGEPGAIEDLEQTVLEQLWSPPQLRQMRRNWCRSEIRPFSLSGTYRGERWRIADLCDADEPWPFQHAGTFGVELFDDYLRFQKNLMRECPQKCIH